MAYPFRDRPLPGRQPDRVLLQRILLFGAAVALGGGIYAATTHPAETAPITLASVVVAGIALIYNGLHNARQARIRFTLDATFQRFSNSIYASHAAVLYRFRPQIDAAKGEADLRKLFPTQANERAGPRPPRPPSPSRSSTSLTTGNSSQRLS
jgi:hypothetical protein